MARDLQARDQPHPHRLGVSVTECLPGKAIQPLSPVSGLVSWALLSITSLLCPYLSTLVSDRSPLGLNSSLSCSRLLLAQVPSGPRAATRFQAHGAASSAVSCECTMPGPHAYSVPTTTRSSYCRTRKHPVPGTQWNHTGHFHSGERESQPARVQEQQQQQKLSFLLAKSVVVISVVIILAVKENAAVNTLTFLRGTGCIENQTALKAVSAQPSFPAQWPLHSCLEAKPADSTAVVPAYLHRCTQRGPRSAHSQPPSPASPTDAGAAQTCWPH